MKIIQRQFVDWKKTGRNLQLLREDNIELRRRVCRALKHGKDNCGGDCGVCKYEMDNHISRKELSDVFGVTPNVIFNWENGRSRVGYEDLMFYCQLSEMDLNDVVVIMGEKI